MTDALDRVLRAGQVEPVEQAVLDAALRKLAAAIGHGGRHVPSRRGIRRRGWLAATAAAAALTAAAGLAAVTGFGHSAVTSNGPGAAGQGRPGAGPATSRTPRPAVSAGSPTAAAVLTAVSASGGDILRVTKIVRGTGPCCKSVIWISPADSPPGSTILGRVKDFTLGVRGRELDDWALSYRAPASAPATADSGCDGIFMRPRIALPPATGVPGSLVLVSYPGRSWIKGNAQIDAATVPSGAALRACLRNGRWHDAGQRVLAGARLIELASPDGSERLWVNARTFLPDRLVEMNPDDGPLITFTFAFLQPTSANLAALRPPHIPAGFSRMTIPGIKSAGKQ